MHRSLLILFIIALPLLVSAKTTATKSRVTATCLTYYNTTTSAFEGDDSTIYKYSGIRSGTMIPGIYNGWQYTGKYDTSIEWYRNSTSMKYYINTGTWHIYDSYNNLIMQVIAKYDTTKHIWTDQFKDVYTYDANNSQTSYLRQTWQITHWTNYSRSSYTFSAANDLATDTTYYWNNVTGTWQPEQLIVYKYDTHHNLTSDIGYSWVTASGTWREGIRYTYYLNASYMQDSSLIETYSTTTGSWTNNSKHFYTYDASGNMISDTSKIVWLLAVIWRNMDLHTYSYTGSDRTGETDYKWPPAINPSTTWSNWTNYIRVFDGSHNMMNKISQTWDTSLSAYVNSSTDYNDYNSYNQPTNYYTFSWNDTSSTWELAYGSYNDRYYYETYNDPTTVPTAGNTVDMKLYPCPTADIMNLDLQWNEAQQAVIIIYDMSGRQLRQWQTEKTTSYHSNIPVSALPAGSYILHVQGNGGQVAKQFTVTH